MMNKEALAFVLAFLLALAHVSCSESPGTCDAEDCEAQSECERLDLNYYGDVRENHLLGKIRYDIGSKTFTFNLVKELAADNNWKHVADATDEIDPRTILTHYKQTREELLESSERLFKELRSQGYKGKFHWNAYLEGLKNTENPNLNFVIKSLDDILDCLEIDRTAMEEVTPKRFRSLKCGRKSLSLIDKVAEEWRSVAKEFGINEQAIFFAQNIPELCATQVLKEMHQRAYTWQDIIKYVEKAELKRVAEKLKRALGNYCVKD